MNRLCAANDDESGCPLVTLEEYFTENNDQCSIGATGTRDFTPHEFLAVLTELRARDDVRQILVELCPPKTPGDWPSTDTIWIVTTLTRTELPRLGLSQAFCDRFLPDDWLTFPRLDGRRTERLKIPDGMRAFGFWYN